MLLFVVGPTGPTTNNSWLQAGRSGNRIPVGARFSPPVQTGPGVHPASFTMGTGSFPGVKSGRDVTLTPHPVLVPWSRKGRAIPLLPLWAVRPVQSLSACTRVHFTLIKMLSKENFIWNINKIKRKSETTKICLHIICSVCPLNIHVTLFLSL